MKIKKNMKQLLLWFTLGLAFLLPMVQTSQVRAEEVYDTPAKAAIAIDPESGKILYAKNADQPMGIASTT